jgi:hypothetical protein
MDQATVFTKTAKGITQVNQRSASLSKDLMKVLKLIDGKSNFGQIAERAELDKNQLEKALNTLTKDGFARVFQTKKEELDPFGDEGGGGDDFDFTAPGKMPVATQRVVPGAANDISELVRQQAKSDADRKSKEQAHTQAAAKAKVEAQVRAKLEAEAKARQEAERQALEQAQKAKEASERARAQVEQQKREEEARQKAIAEQQVKLTAEQKAKEEAESRRLAELRVKAEREAKALAEARARAEAEAAAMAKARAEADAAAKKQATEASQAQAEMKARLKEEIEARIRGEMEELLKNEVEDKTRESMKAEIMAEAKLAAQAELEERLRDEREAIARAEAEARTKAEQEAKARADIESKKRAEAEARAKAETEARIRAEEETKRLRAEMEVASKRAAEAAASAKADAEARARAEAEARARDAAESEKRLEAERQAKYEAEARAKIEAEEREKRERELSAEIETARKAREEAEARARIEAKARETIAEDTRAKVQAELEGDLEKRAEIEGKAQAKAYMQAKVKAEEEEEQKIRDEQAKRAREIADVLRTKVDAEEKVEAAPRRRAVRRGSLVKPAIFGLLALAVVVIGLLHIVPLRPYTAKVEKTLAEWLQDDVSIGSMTFRLVPSPHLRVENVSVGKSLDARAASGRVDLAIMSLFGDKPSIDSIELENITISPEAVQRIPRWGRPEGKGEGGGIERIVLRGVKLEVKPALDPFNATMNFTRDGVMRQATLNAPSGWAVTVKPGERGFEFDATARNLDMPIGPAFPVADSRFKGTIEGNQIVVPEYEIETMGGTVKGALRISWGQNVKLESEMALAKINAGELVAAFTKAIVITGKLDGGFNFATEGPTLERIFASPRAQGKFSVAEGTISNVDLVAVMQSESAGTRAGVTKFNQLAGELSSGDSRSSFSKLSLEGGVLRGGGGVDVAQSGNLSGRLQIEIRSKVASDRGTFSLTGSVSRPILKRSN